MHDQSKHSAARNASLNDLRIQIEEDLGDRYHGLVFVGAGGSATVWRAFDLESQCWVAVKRLSVSEESARSYYRELATLFRLIHRNINTLHTIKESPHTARYLILEYCAGGHLGQLLESQLKHAEKSELERLCRTALIQIANGLEYAHHFDFIHRDVKPANILLSKFQGPEINMDLEIKISDFGLARGTFPSMSANESALKGLSGTPIYMAPELFAGQRATSASDVYSVGVMAYEILCGHPPFSGGVKELAKAHCYTEPLYNELSSDAWTSLLKKLLAKYPRDRPTAKEIPELVRATQSDLRSE